MTYRNYSNQCGPFDAYGEPRWNNNNYVPPNPFCVQANQACVCNQPLGYCRCPPPLPGQLCVAPNKTCPPPTMHPCNCQSTPCGCGQNPCRCVANPCNCNDSQRESQNNCYPSYQWFPNVLCPVCSNQCICSKCSQCSVCKPCTCNQNFNSCNTCGNNSQECGCNRSNRFQKGPRLKPCLARDLINRAWFLSGIVGRNLQFPTGEQTSDGLFLLNALLDFKQIETDLIPYWTYIEFEALPRQEYYFLPYVAAIESLTFNINVIRYPMESVTRRNYYGSARVDNISTLPFSWNYNRALGGGNLALYFKPATCYPLKAMVKLFLTDVCLDTDMSNVSECVPYRFVNSSNQGYDSSYLEYLRYALAEFMCSEFGVIFNPQSAKILESYKRKLMYISPPDLSIIKQSILNNNEQIGYNYGDINIGRGFRPS